MSIIDSLGRNYCNEWLNGALIVYEGNVYRIVEFLANEAVCTRVTQHGYGQNIRIPNTWFTGFGKLAYPPLGYRRVGNMVMHLTRRQSAQRGLRIASIGKDYSPLTWAIISYNDPYTGEQLAVRGQMRDYAIEHSIMLPAYDNMNQLPELLTGDRPNLVLNENVLIEVNHHDTFNIYYKTMKVGEIDRSGRITAEDAFSSITNPVYQRVA